jgi:hypothetical protein
VLFLLVPSIAMVLDIIGNNKVRPFTYAYFGLWILMSILYWFFSPYSLLQHILHRSSGDYGLFHGN